MSRPLRVVAIVAVVQVKSIYQCSALMTEAIPATFAAKDVVAAKVRGASRALYVKVWRNARLLALPTRIAIDTENVSTHGSVDAVFAKTAVALGTRDSVVNKACSFTCFARFYRPSRHLLYFLQQKCLKSGGTLLSNWQTTS